jgi:hypothetical protein
MFTDLEGKGGRETEIVSTWGRISIFGEDSECEDFGVRGVSGWRTYSESVDELGRGEGRRRDG